MKKTIINIAFFVFISLVLIGCDNPAPTELVLDNNTSTDDQVNIEVIAVDTQDEFYSNGFDSTGVAQQLSSFRSIIVVTGSKITEKNKTFNSSIAQAFFFDKRKPIFALGGRVIGFKTITPGVVKFNGKKARIVPFRKRYKNNGTTVDTTLGFKYLLFSGRANQIDAFVYRVNSTVSFQLIPFVGNPRSFTIETPNSVTGKVTFTGKKRNLNLKAILEWNKGNKNKIEIILGAKIKGRNVAIPLYRLKTRDDGRFVVPTKLLNTIPFDKFDKIIFSFVRKLDAKHGTGANLINVFSQSIHTIIIDIP